MKLTEIFIEQQPNSMFQSNVANIMTINKKCMGTIYTTFYSNLFCPTEIPVRLISGSTGHRRTHVTIRS